MVPKLERRVRPKFSGIIDKIMSASKSLPHSKPFFYQVPDALRQLNRKAYTPCLVSVGPLHREDKNLKPERQEMKNHCAYALFHRLCHDESKNKSHVIEDIINEISECESAVTRLIEDLASQFSCQSVDKLVDKEMLVVDGCFVLEVLYRNHLWLKKSGESKSWSESEIEKLIPKFLDPVFGSEHARLALQHDLMLLENQLPFSMLSELFNRTINKLKDSPSLEQLVISYWGNILDLDPTPFPDSPTKGCSSSHCYIPISDGTIPEEEPTPLHHMLHLLHRHYSRILIKDKPDPDYNPDGKRLMPCASDLHCAGIKFVSDTGNNQSNKIQFHECEGLLGWFCRPRFQIPIQCKERTEPMLRNLIAFEQCCPGITPCFTSYALLMDALIDTDKDVEVLEDAKVMNNYLKTKDDAAQLFNNLSKENAIKWEEFCFAKICKEVDEYSKRPWAKVRKWPASLALHVKRTYLSTPWSFIGFFLAFLATGLQIANFVFRFVDV